MNPKPNFQVMTRKQLRAYVLTHREDDEAFYAYVDKVNEEKNRVVHPPVNSVKELETSPQYADLRKAALREKVLQLCDDAIGLNGITSCGEAPPDSPKPWFIERYGEKIYLTLQEAQDYLQGL